MFSMKSLFAQAALILTSLLGVYAANAQTCFTVASLQGDYAVVGNYGANVAIAFAIRHLDGNGNLTATFVVNEPTAGSTTGARTIVWRKIKLPEQPRRHWPPPRKAIKTIRDARRAPEKQRHK